MSVTAASAAASAGGLAGLGGLGRAAAATATGGASAGTYGNRAAWAAASAGQPPQPPLATKASTTTTTTSTDVGPAPAATATATAPSATAATTTTATAAATTTAATQQHAHAKLQPEPQPHADVHFPDPPASLLHWQPRQHNDRQPQPQPPRPTWRGEEDEFLTLRHRLDQLSYTHHLDPSSVDLVRHLLADLIQSTDSARSLKSQLELCVQERDAAAEQVRPLRSEIGRLSAENNGLHADLVAMADERDAREKRNAAARRAVEAQMSELRFMVGQYAARVETEQRRAEDARTRVEDVIGRVGGTGTAGTAGGAGGTAAAKKGSKAEKMFQRLQKIDIETGLEPLDHAPVYFVPPDPVVGDMVRLAEGQIETLIKGTRELESKNTDLENEVQNAREQLAKREREIQRLGAQLEIARSQQFGPGQRLEPRPSSPSKRGSASPVKGSSRTAGIVDLDAAKDRIEQLEIQIEYLQEHIDGLEKELGTIEGERDTVQTAFVTERDQLALELAAERERTSGLLGNLARLQSMVNDLAVVRGPSPAAKQQPQQPLHGGGKHAASSAQTQSSVKHLKQIAELTDKVKTTQQKLEQTTRRLNAAVAEKQKLAHELDQIKNGPQTAGRADAAVSTRDRDSPTKKDHDARVRDLELAQVTLRADLESSQSQLRHLQSVQSELDALKPKHTALQKDLAAAQSQVSLLTSKAANSARFSQELMETQRRVLADLNDAQRERDDLLRALERFSDQVDDLHGRVQSVTSDRDNLKQLYEQVNREVQRLRTDPNASGPAPAAGAAASGGVADSTGSALATGKDGKEQQQQQQQQQQDDTADKLRESEARLRDQVRSLQDEISKLQSDLQATVLRQKETGATATEALSQLESETDRLKAGLAQSESARMALQTEIRDLKIQIEGLEDDKHDVDRQLDRSKIRINQLEMDHDKDQFQLRDLRSRLSEAEEALDKANAECESLRVAAAERDRLLAEQKQLMSEIDRERDGFQTDLDRKAERILELTDQLARVRSDGAQAAQDLLALREQLDMANHNLDQQDRELLSLQRQLDQTAHELEHYQVTAARNGEEASNLASDLSALTRENQMLNAELMQISMDADTLKSQLAESERQLAYLDDLVHKKDIERENIMASYRKLISEHERQDQILASWSEEGKQTKMEVVLRDKRVQQLQTELDEKTQELLRSRTDLLAFGKQVGQLTNLLATAERVQRGLESDKKRMEREVMTLRELVHTFEQGKQEAAMHLEACEKDKRQLQHTIGILEVDLAAVNSRYNAECNKSQRYEILLKNERNKFITTEHKIAAKQAAKADDDEQAKGLADQQSAALASANDEILALKARIQSLERLLQSKQADLEEAHKKMDAMRAKISSLQEQVRRKDRSIHDVMSLQRRRADSAPVAPAAPGGIDDPGADVIRAMDQQLERELKSTHSQRRRVDKVITQRQQHHESSELRTRLGEAAVPSTTDDSSGANWSSVVSTSADESGTTRSDDDALVSEFLERGLAGRASGAEQRQSPTAEPRNVHGGSPATAASSSDARTPRQQAAGDRIPFDQDRQVFDAILEQQQEQ
ncbi:hypothetical protein BC831DRAFT_511187 [Entophlyctis helioformis]|nr:hypothetical protein BC831DRAFT_511187 [Entophlyctis helioformis]